MTKKITFMFLFFVLISSVYGDINTFSNTIMVKSYNSTLNITTEEDSRIFDCMQNSTSVYTFNLKRNITTCDEVAKTLNTNTDKLLSTCDSFAKQYSDVSRYFQLYTTCNLENEICKKDKQDKDKSLNELTSYKSGYESLNSELKNIRGFVIPALILNSSALHTNLTMCNEALLIEGNNKILWGFGGAIVIGFFWLWEKKKQTHITKRSKISSTLNPR